MSAFFTPVVLRWLAIGLVAVAVGVTGWVKGAASVQEDWDLANAQREAAQWRALGRAYERVRSVESIGRAEIAEQSRQYREEMHRETSRRDRTIAELRAGTVRLSVPAGGAAAGDLRLPGTTGAGSGSDGAEVTYLPAATAADLAALAGEADDITRQLGLCQAAVITIGKSSARHTRH
ncbi:MAG: lysis system i-spanin subunit Rz [Moraxellaceae bacterium]|nr:lysis system i-spanin subunit Rz [Moraxellaceae bacterium]